MKTTVTDKMHCPYADNSVNTIYNLLFCDNPELYRMNAKQPLLYPWNFLLSPDTDTLALLKIIDSADTETRHKILAYRRLSESGYHIEKKDLLGVIVEVGLEEGLDVIASYNDGSARYINQTGKMILWDAWDATSVSLINDLFQKSTAIVAQTGPYNAPRRPFPPEGMVRISFLVSDGLYFGEAPANIFFNDPLAKPALFAAAALMQFLTEKVLNKHSEAEVV